MGKKNLTPREDIFIDMKNSAIKICKTFNNEGGYATEKLNYIHNIENNNGDAMMLYRMFDVVNREFFINNVKKDTLNYINQNK